MIPSREPPGSGIVGCTCWLVLAWCGVLAMPLPAAAAEVPPPSREELMRKWDLNRDGKVDASETEIARSRMRRARTDSLMNSGADPVTGRPRMAIDPVTGRAVTPPETPAGIPGAPTTDRGGLSAPADDGGLILVPGTGAHPGDAGTGQHDREALPGTRVPAAASTVPSVTPRVPTGMGLRSSASPSATGPQGASSGPGASDRELSSRARILPTTPQSQNPAQNPGTRDPRARGVGQERQQGAADRPGIISGGVRAGGAAARPGYGAGGPPADLNAGRLPAGLPQTRGIAPGTGVGPRTGAAAQPGSGRLAGPGQSTARTGMGPYRGPAAPSTPSTGMPVPTLPSLRQPATGRPASQTPSTMPRVPRVSTDDFYGR